MEGLALTPTLSCSEGAVLQFLEVLLYPQKSDPHHFPPSSQTSLALYCLSPVVESSVDVETQQTLDYVPL